MRFKECSNKIIYLKLSVPREEGERVWIFPKNTELSNSKPNTDFRIYVFSLLRIPFLPKRLKNTPEIKTWLLQKAHTENEAIKRWRPMGKFDSLETVPTECNIVGSQDQKPVISK